LEFILRVGYVLLNPIAVAGMAAAEHAIVLAFAVYPKVPSRLGNIVLRQVKNGKAQWIMTEKVRGANRCCLVSEAGSITYSRQKAL